jgi:hypothetical protein
VVVGESVELEEWILRDDNEPAWALWSACRTQWRIGMAGPVGLDYCAVEAAMRMTGVARNRRAGLFGDLRLVEATVMRVWAQEPKA